MLWQAVQMLKNNKTFSKKVVSLYFQQASTVVSIR